MQKVKSWQGAATVEEIHDGDTFKAQIDLGFRIYLKCNVRLAGVGAPELSTPQGAPARDALVRLLPPGTIVTLESRRLDKYGRAEARVLAADGTDINAAMIAEGFAVAADDRGAL
jgi:endonuclease YncB( thermonuclease family)